jgi:WhiB family redox-sensing transcriptional regulator
MWKPANDLGWQKKALCAQPENQDKKEWFFSSSSEERYKAKNLCFQCPVRKECVQWALENKQIWGVWGGRDEVDLRRALSVNHEGEETRRRRFPNCPHCGARPVKLITSEEELPGGGRWKVAKIVTCTQCEFSWRSRTSANAVEAYHQDRAKRLEKQEKEKAKKSSRKPPARKTPSSSEADRPSD